MSDVSFDAVSACYLCAAVQTTYFGSSATASNICNKATYFFSARNCWPGTANSNFERVGHR